VFLPFKESIFDHLGESCSELKSEWSKSTIAACPVGRRDWATAHEPALGGTTSDIWPTPECPSHQGKSGLKHPEPTPPKAVWWGGITSIVTQSSVPTLRRTEKKSLSKVPAPGFEVGGKSSERSANWFFSFLLNIFNAVILSLFLLSSFSFLFCATIYCLPISLFHSVQILYA
jgi:hypothetical protein